MDTLIAFNLASGFRHIPADNPKSTKKSNLHKESAMATPNTWELDKLLSSASLLNNKAASMLLVGNGNVGNTFHEGRTGPLGIFQTFRIYSLFL
jgi:hypothetical protein